MAIQTMLGREYGLDHLIDLALIEPLAWAVSKHGQSVLVEVTVNKLERRKAPDTKMKDPWPLPKTRRYADRR